MPSKRREKKSAGLKYGMRPFSGSRQSPGPAAADLARLREEGILFEDKGEQPDPSGGDSPPPAGDAEDAGDAGDADDAGAPPSATSAATKGDSASSPARSRSRPQTRPSGRSGRANYTLPPKRPKGQKSRSCHFRLPGEIDGILTELAEHHDCSRTHVVCSTILAEWQRLQRALARAGKRGQAPRGGSGG